ATRRDLPRQRRRRLSPGFVDRYPRYTLPIGRALAGPLTRPHRTHRPQIDEAVGALGKSRIMPEEKGLLIVYTGPGKGKTTCALGTAFRAVGQGLRVLMVQFIKGSWHYGELDAAKMLGDDKFEIRPMGRGFVKIGGAETNPEDIKLAEECWNVGREAIYSEKYDLVVLDEINYVISYKMLDPEKIVAALKDRPERVHVICTGRNAHPKLVELADL